MEEEHNYLPTMQAYLTTSTASNGGKEFKLSTFLSSLPYAEIVIDYTNTSQPSINEPSANVTAANNSRIVNCATLVHLNQTEISVEVIFSWFNTDVKNIYKYHKIPIVNSTYSYYLLVLISFYEECSQNFLFLFFWRRLRVYYLSPHIFS